ncbi:MAG: cupin domain-containing protein [Maritimibacter sp.]|jgi:uncharacterized cupin superfamily protein
MSDNRYHIPAEDIAAMEGLDKTHFLNPNAKRINKSLGDLAGLTGFGFHIIEVEPGRETTEHHRHFFEDECVYVLSGEATARIGDDRFQVKSGDFLGYRKGGEAHSIINTGEEVLRCIVVGERLAHDMADYTDQKKRIYRNAGMEWNLVAHDDIETPSGGEK